MKTTAWIIVASLASLSVGLALGWRLHPREEARPGTAVMAGPASAARLPSQTNRQSSAEPDRTTRVADLLARRAGADRAAELRLALRDCDAAGLQQWAEVLAVAAPSLTRDADRQLVFELWARRQPAEALARAEQEADPRVRSSLLAAVATGAMTADPAAALRWVSRDARDEVVQAGLEALAQVETGQAAALLAGMAEASPAFRQRAWWAIVENAVAAGDYARGQEIVRTVADAGLQARLTASLADAWGRADPRRAAEWASSEAPAAVQPQTLANLGAIWAAREPLAATEFAARLPTGPARQRMLTETILQWSTTDLVAASNWLNRLDSTPDNDPAIAAIATDSRLVLRAPETALSWAESISVAGTRVEALAAIVRAWRERDAAAAERYLTQASTLSAEDRLAVRARLQARPGE